jgi:hypothetical protein
MQRARGDAASPMEKAVESIIDSPSSRLLDALMCVANAHSCVGAAQQDQVIVPKGRAALVGKQVQLAMIDPRRGGIVWQLGDRLPASPAVATANDVRAAVFRASGLAPCGPRNHRHHGYESAVIEPRQAAAFHVVLPIGIVKNDRAALSQGRGPAACEALGGKQHRPVQGDCGALAGREDGQNRFARYCGPLQMKRGYLTYW